MKAIHKLLFVLLFVVIKQLANCRSIPEQSDSTRIGPAIGNSLEYDNIFTVVTEGPLMLFFIIMVIIILSFGCCGTEDESVSNSIVSNQPSFPVKGVVQRDDKQKYRIPSGIQNIDESCYLNASIQSLASCDKLLVHLQQILDKGEMIVEVNDLLVLLKSLNDSSNRHHAENAENLKKLVNKAGWNKTSQQDAYELLSKILNNIVRALEARQLEIIPLMIRIETYHHYDPSDNPNQKYLGLQLTLPDDCQNIELSSMITSFFDKSPIDGDTNLEIQQVLTSVPNILLLHIQANKFCWKTKTIIKPKYTIHLKKTETFSLVIKDESNSITTEAIEYELKSYVVHFGSTSVGHYVAYRKLDNHWYLINDDQVQKTQLENPYQPYILIYEIIEK